jgi:hypothetical protein
MNNRLSCGSHHVDDLMELVTIHIGIMNFSLLILVFLLLFGLVQDYLAEGLINLAYMLQT